MRYAYAKKFDCIDYNINFHKSVKLIDFEKKAVHAIFGSFKKYRKMNG